MADANAQHLWERSLREEIYDSNAVLRRDRQFHGAEINYEPIRKEAQDLGIDPDRALRIAVAATRDFDWAEAVDSMVRENVSQEYAEKIATKISLQIASTRSLRDHSLEFYGCVSKVVEIGFGASPSGLSFAAVRPRGQGFRRRLADRGFPIHRLCASGFGRKRGAPRGASALFRDTAARSVF